ncbi:hypothetical protein Scep_022951 [Stephania cephalantha]|uniref:Golgin candidate 2 n=1 Tax=Stephania cephalantha TaxID=152367 RepID=A0AAP0I1A9_9MAGN
MPYFRIHTASLTRLRLSLHNRVDLQLLYFLDPDTPDEILENLDFCFFHHRTSFIHPDVLTLIKPLSALASNGVSSANRDLEEYGKAIKLVKESKSIAEDIDQQAAESLRKSEKPQQDEFSNVASAPSPRTESAVPLKDQLKKRSMQESREISGSLLRDTGIDRNRKVGTPPRVSLDAKPMPVMTDSDWTELLSGSKKQPSPSGANRGNGGISLIRGQLKDVKKSSEVKRRQRGNGGGFGSRERLGIAGNGGAVSGKHSKGSVGKDTDEINALRSVLVSAEFDGATEGKMRGDDNGRKLRIENSDSVPRSSTASNVHSSSSDEGTSGSDTDSTLSSDSENERRRKTERARRKELILAEKAAAKAIEVIKERENVVARLEGEKQSLEKMLEERSKQQAQEASELQTSMTETMDAVELEKQKHNNTRMEALTRLAKLETSNADLARILATTQWNLEIKVGASKGVEFEREILEAEYSFTCDKVKQLQEKARNLEENIEITRKELEVPTEVEIELKRRLGQLTDHLIQKQAQVEGLSSEKATLLFRIETVSRMLDECKSSPQGPLSCDDLEAGKWELNSLYSAGATFLRRNPMAKFWTFAYFLCLHFWVAYIFMSDSKASDDTVSGAVVSLAAGINKTIGS